MCDVTDCDDGVPDDVLALEEVLELVPLVVAVVAEVESSDSPESSDSRDDELFEVDFVEVADAVWVVVAAWPSCQASAPPSESIAATLSAVAALRARAARGLRVRGAVPGRERSGGMAVGSSMTVTVRTGGERVARAG